MIDLVDKILKEIKPSESEILNFSGYWIPLQWVYVELVKNKDLAPIGEIGQAEKTRYWNLTSGERWKRICLCQSLYVWEQLKDY